MMRHAICLISLLCMVHLVPGFCLAAVSGTKTSTINVRIDALTSDIGNLLTQSINKDMYKGQGSLGTSVQIVRTGPVVVTADNNFVFLSIPVQLTFGYGMLTSSPLRTDLRFKAKMEVTPDWRLKTELYYLGLSEGLVDTLRVGLVTVKPKSLVESVTLPVQKLLSPIVDAKINEMVKLRDKVAPVWRDSFNPVLVDKKFSTWLRLAPEKIVMSPISAANNRIRLTIGLVTAAEIVVGPKPAVLPARPLPQLQPLPNFANQFHVQVPTDVFFADLVGALNPILLNQTFGDEKKITVRSFNLKSDGGRLVIDLTSTGDFEGGFTLVAKPVCNPQKNTLTFDDIDFDTRDAGLLVGVGSWLFSGTIRDVIKEKLNATVATQLESARGKASAALAKVKLAEHVELSGSVTALSLGEAVVAADRLSVQLIAEGNSSINLK